MGHGSVPSRYRDHERRLDGLQRGDSVGGHIGGVGKETETAASSGQCAGPLDLGYSRWAATRGSYNPSLGSRYHGSLKSRPALVARILGGFGASGHSAMRDSRLRCEPVKAADQSLLPGVVTGAREVPGQPYLLPSGSLGRLAAPAPQRSPVAQSRTYCMAWGPRDRRSAGGLLLPPPS